MKGLAIRWLASVLVVFVPAAAWAQAQSSKGSSTGTSHNEEKKVSATRLEQEFFELLRTGDPSRLLTYIPAGGVNVGSSARHLSRPEVEEQMASRSGLYCKLFDSACIHSEIKLDQSNVRACSYRELLTKSKDVHTAATETTRNGVRQAILVARMKNDQCAGVGLVDFIFNLESDGWKLFSIP